MDMRDTFLQSTFPVLAMPKFGVFDPLEQTGHRFLTGSNGLGLEVRRPWLYLRKLAMVNESGLALPYGDVTEIFDLCCGPIPREFLMRFAEQAKRAGEVETAAWITWSEMTRAFAYRKLDERMASADAVDVDRPELEPGEHLVVDLHSHGHSLAFFSPTDNGDDRGEVKFSVVLGCCYRERLETFDIVARLCVLGMSIPVSESFSLKEVEHVA
jgi:PRTRC genetic system protein A